MKKVLIVFSLICLLGLPAAAVAEEVDMAKVTCKEFMESGKEGMGMMLTWIDGYISAKSDNTNMSEQWMEKLGQHMGGYCAKYPNKTIMSAIESMPAE